MPAALTGGDSKADAASRPGVTTPGNATASSVVALLPSAGFVASRSSLCGGRFGTGGASPGRFVAAVPRWDDFRGRVTAELAVPSREVLRLKFWTEGLLEADAALTGDAPLLEVLDDVLDRRDVLLFNRFNGAST